MTEFRIIVTETYEKVVDLTDEQAALYDTDRRHELIEEVLDEHWHPLSQEAKDAFWDETDLDIEEA